MSKSSTRIGMISVEHGHAFSYARAISEFDDAEIIGVWNEEAAAGRKFAEEIGAPYLEELDQLLALEPDGAIICSANANHRSHVEAAAGRARGILCEKPIATTIEDGQAMIRRCRETTTKLQIAFPVRFHPVFQQMKNTIENENIGRILALECTNHGSMPGSWFVEPTLSGGGAVIDHTVHVIDLIRWIWRSEIVEVYAEIGDSLLHPGLGVDDAGILSFQLANGIYGSLDTSWSRPPSFPTWGDVKIEAVGDGGVAYADMSRQHVSIASNAAGKTRWAPFGSNMDRSLVRDFIDMLQTGNEPSITGEDGLTALAVALAAYESSRLGEPIQVRSIE